jgi:RNA polymerase sigma-70 factor (ECF subfamily)
MAWFRSCAQRGLKTEIEGSRERLYRLAYAWCHDSALADDLAQEAVARGLTRAGQLRETEKLGGWLFAILNHCWLDHLRARREDLTDEALLDLPSDQPGPDGHAERSQTVGRIRAAVAALPLGQRQVVTLVDLEELSYAEVAEALSIPIGTVMSRLCRARAALRQLLEPAAERRLRSVK